MTTVTNNSIIQDYSGLYLKVKGLINEANQIMEGDVAIQENIAAETFTPSPFVFTYTTGGETYSADGTYTIADGAAITDANIQNMFAEAKRSIDANAAAITSLVAKVNSIITALELAGVLED